MPVPERLRKARVAHEEQSGRRILLNRTGLAGGERREVEIRSTAVLVGVGDRGFPTQAGVQGEARRSSKRVLDIQPDEALSQVVGSGVGLAETAHSAEQEISQRAAAARAVKCE